MLVSYNTIPLWLLQVGEAVGVLWVRCSYCNRNRILIAARLEKLIGCSRPVRRVAMVPVVPMLWKSSVLEIPLDKELNAKCSLKPCTNLKELVPAAMVKCGVIKEAFWQRLDFWSSGLACCSNLHSAIFNQMSHLDFTKGGKKRKAYGPND